MWSQHADPVEKTVLFMLTTIHGTEMEKNIRNCYVTELMFRRDRSVEQPAWRDTECGVSLYIEQVFIEGIAQSSPGFNDICSCRE